MPSQNAKLGLIAFGIVGGMTALLLVGLGILLLAKGEDGKRPGGAKTETKENFKSENTPQVELGLPADDSPIPPHKSAPGLRKTKEELYAYDFEYVRRHKWWKKALSVQQLSKMVSEFVSTNSGHHFWIAQDGKYAVQEMYPGSRFDRIVIAPHELGKANHTYADIDGIRRPEKHDAIISLLVILDAAEFRDGAGR